jgi:hypothetical protein
LFLPNRLRCAISICIGQIRHKGICHPGEHEAIVERDTWEQTQTLLSAHRVRGTARVTKCAPSPLAARLFDERGEPLTPSHAVKGRRRYRYYVSRKLIQGEADKALAVTLMSSRLSGIANGTFRWLGSLFRRGRVPYEPISVTFPPVDVLRYRRELDLEGEGKRRGAEGLPARDNLLLDDIEQRIVGYRG